jgi:hypothetical protein
LVEDTTTSILIVVLAARDVDCATSPSEYPTNHRYLVPSLLYLIVPYTLVSLLLIGPNTITILPGIVTDNTSLPVPLGPSFVNSIRSDFKLRVVVGSYAPVTPNISFPLAIFDAIKLASPLIV